MNIDKTLMQVGSRTEATKVSVEPSAAHTASTSHSSMLEILENECKKIAGGGGGQTRGRVKVRNATWLYEFMEIESACAKSKA